MKKILALILSLAMVLAFAAACTPADPAETDPTPTAEVPSDEPEVTQDEETPDDVPADVLSYAEYMAAALDTEVTVETYVQAKQSWWDNKATVYTQDEDGAYFLYNMVCSEEDYSKLVTGTKIRVTGYKAEWSGEVEIVDATFEIIDGSYIAEPADLTALLGDESLIAHQNEFFAMRGLTVETSVEGEEVAFLYNWDGSGEEGSDLYFNVSLDGTTYTFTVESYLCDSSTEVYSAVKNLKVGDTIDVEGFLYWYEGVNPHITAVTAAA
ncbi:MAG: hypothetical protein LBH17_07240 [Oscillospiraceae bacterium]|jgi:hypothetical protein|nr:hypothetical protein [Oscillospiraceae bacterium]